MFSATFIFDFDIPAIFQKRTNCRSKSCSIPGCGHNHKFLCNPLPPLHVWMKYILALCYIDEIIAMLFICPKISSRRRGKKINENSTRFRENFYLSTLSVRDRLIIKQSVMTATAEVCMHSFQEQVDYWFKRCLRQYFLSRCCSGGKFFHTMEHGTRRMLKEFHLLTSIFTLGTVPVM